MTTDTNIKNLPEGEYFTEIGYSQQYPWTVIKRTAKTVTLAKVVVDTDPEWMAKKEFYPGGFVGHTPNQHAQTWLFKGINPTHTKTIRLNKRGQWKRGETLFIENRAREFYDYNF